MWICLQFGGLYVEGRAAQECAICALTWKLLGTTDLYTQNSTADSLPVISPPPSSREKRPLVLSNIGPSGRVYQRHSLCTNFREILYYEFHENLSIESKSG
jgi:hypothetical protein